MTLSEWNKTQHKKASKAIEEYHKMVKTTPLEKAHEAALGNELKTLHQKLATAHDDAIEKAATIVDRLWPEADELIDSILALKTDKSGEKK
jgi:uncharacterized coiled-coil DUF342 family protein